MEDFFYFSTVFCENNGLHWCEWFPVTTFLSNKIWKKLGTCITLNAWEISLNKKW